MIRGITAYGMEIVKKLWEMEKSQKWLIGEVAEKTGLYFDSSYLYKIMTGKLRTPSVVKAINEILSLEVTA